MRTETDSSGAAPKPLLGGIEAGGTKIVCGVGTGPDDIRSIEIPTLTPQLTLARVIDFFAGHRPGAIGVASFGPVDLNRESPTYGYITETPKLAWRNCDLVGTLSRALGVPVALDTDVNAAALGEGAFGAAKGLANFVYFTVGTGIGGGAVSGGRLIHGVMHPEMGHIPVRRHPDDQLAGLCPSHGDCLEGLASGPAIAARWGTASEQLPAGHAGWAMEAFYLAQAALSATLLLSPECIVFGGGVIKQESLPGLITAEFHRQLGDYLKRPPGIAVTALRSAGLVGALILARHAADMSSSPDVAP